MVTPVIVGIIPTAALALLDPVDDDPVDDDPVEVPLAVLEAAVLPLWLALATMLAPLARLAVVVVLAVALLTSLQNTWPLATPLEVRQSVRLVIS